MAAIYLGITISGLAPLPPIRWTGGGSPNFAIDYSKQLEKATMLSGRQRFNIKSEHPRRWSLSWEMLTVAEFTDLVTLHDYDQALYFQNNWEDATWRQVVFVRFEPEVVVKLGLTACRWNLSIVLEEVL